MIIDEVPYLSPDSHPGHYFAEHFDDATTLGVKWTKSQAKKDGMDSEIAKVKIAYLKVVVIVLDCNISY